MAGQRFNLKHTIKIAECVCDHEYQDKKYGKKRRVHNPTKDGYRCTVCGRTHTGN